MKTVFITKLEKDGMHYDVEECPVTCVKETLGGYKIVTCRLGNDFYNGIVDKNNLEVLNFDQTTSMIIPCIDTIKRKFNLSKDRFGKIKNLSLNEKYLETFKEHNNIQVKGTSGKPLVLQTKNFIVCQKHNDVEKISHYQANRHSMEKIATFTDLVFLTSSKWKITTQEGKEALYDYKLGTIISPQVDCLNVICENDDNSIICFLDSIKNDNQEYIDYFGYLDMNGHVTAVFEMDQEGNNQSLDTNKYLQLKEKPKDNNIFAKIDVFKKKYLTNKR